MAGSSLPLCCTDDAWGTSWGTDRDPTRVTPKLWETVGGGFTGREGLNTCPPRFVGSLWAQGPAWPFLSLLQQLGHPHPFCWGHFKVVQTGLFLIFRCLGQGRMSGLAFGQSLRHGHLNPFPLQAKPCPG